LEDVLIKHTEKLLHKPLRDLPAKDLARIGVSVTEVVDEAFVAPVDSGVDKMINALLADALTAEIESAAV